MAQINNDIYEAALPLKGGEVPTINLAKPEAAAFPARQLTVLGGEFPHWNSDGSEVHWSLGNAFFTYNFEEAKKVEEELDDKSRNTNTVQYIVKNGRMYDGNTLDEVYPRQQKAPMFFDTGNVPGTGLPGVRE